MTDIAQTGDQPSRATRNYTLAMLVAIYASSHVDRQIVSILAESIKQELLLSDTQLGFLIGLSFAIFYATLGMPIDGIVYVRHVRDQTSATGALSDTVR